MALLQKLLFLIKQTTSLSHRFLWCHHRITEQFEVGRDLQNSSGPTPWLKPSHLEPVAKNQVLWYFIISKDSESTISPGNLCQCSVTLTGKKRCFLMLRGNLLCFTLCLVPLTLSLGYHWKKPVCLTHIYCYTQKCTFKRQILLIPDLSFLLLILFGISWN